MGRVWDHGQEMRLCASRRLFLEGGKSGVGSRTEHCWLRSTSFSVASTPWPGRRGDAVSGKAPSIPDALRDSAPADRVRICSNFFSALAYIVLFAALTQAEELMDTKFFDTTATDHRFMGGQLGWGVHFCSLHHDGRCRDACLTT